MSVRAFPGVFLGLALLVLAASGASAEEASKLPQFKAVDYPIAVRESLSYAPLECRRQGGGKVKFAPDTVHRVDLDGDGIDDYVVDFSETECPGAVSAFCSTGGCLKDFLLVLPHGRIRSVFSGHIRGYEILPGKAPRTVRFNLHGGYCGDFGSAPCAKERRMDGKPFLFRMPVE